MTASQQPDTFYGDAYHSVRADIARLLRDHPAGADLPVPACPGWSVRDLVGHLLQVCRTVVAEVPSDLPDIPAPEQGPSVDEHLARWAELDDALTEVLARATGLRPRITLLDVVSHELDIRGALGLPVPGDQAAFAFTDSLELATMGFGLSVGQHGLPALRFETPDGTWLSGEGEPAATVRGTSLDVFRSLTGRRALTQIGELSWSAPPETWWPAFTWGPFTPPKQLTEHATLA